MFKIDLNETEENENTDFPNFIRHQTIDSFLLFLSFSFPY